MNAEEWDAIQFIKHWNAAIDLEDQPKPPRKGTPHKVWWADTPSGIVQRRRARTKARKEAA